MESIIGFIVVALLIVAGVFVMSHFIGKASLCVVSDVAPEQIRDAARSCIPPMLWAPESGPGIVNMRRKALRARGRSVVSASIEAVPMGRHLVTVWMGSVRRVGPAAGERRHQPGWAELDATLAAVSCGGVPGRLSTVENRNAGSGSSGRCAPRKMCRRSGNWCIVGPHWRSRTVRDLLRR